MSLNSFLDIQQIISGETEFDTSAWETQAIAFRRMTRTQKYQWLDSISFTVTPPPLPVDVLNPPKYLDDVFTTDSAQLRVVGGYMKNFDMSGFFELDTERMKNVTSSQDGPLIFYKLKESITASKDEVSARKAQAFQLAQLEHLQFRDDPVIAICTYLLAWTGQGYSPIPEPEYSEIRRNLKETTPAPSLIPVEQSLALASLQALMRHYSPNAPALPFMLKPQELVITNISKPLSSSLGCLVAMLCEMAGAEFFGSVTPEQCHARLSCYFKLFYGSPMANFLKFKSAYQSTIYPSIGTTITSGWEMLIKRLPTNGFHYSIQGMSQLDYSRREKFMPKFASTTAKDRSFIQEAGIQQEMEWFMGSVTGVTEFGPSSSILMIDHFATAPTVFLATVETELQGELAEKFDHGPEPYPPGTTYTLDNLPNFDNCDPNNLWVKAWHYYRNQVSQVVVTPFGTTALDETSIKLMTATQKGGSAADVFDYTKGSLGENPLTWKSRVKTSTKLFTLARLNASQRAALVSVVHKIPMHMGRRVQIARRARAISSVNPFLQHVVGIIYMIMARSFKGLNAVPANEDPDRKLIPLISTNTNHRVAVTCDRKHCDASTTGHIMSVVASAIYYECKKAAWMDGLHMGIGDQMITLEDGTRVILNATLFSCYILAKVFTDGIPIKLVDMALKQTTQMNLKIFFTGLLITSNTHVFNGLMLMTMTINAWKTSSNPKVAIIGRQFDMNLDFVLRGDDALARIPINLIDDDTIDVLVQTMVNVHWFFGFTLDIIMSNTQAEFLKKLTLYGISMPLVYRHPVALNEPGKTHEASLLFPYTDLIKSIIAVKVQEGAPPWRIRSWAWAYVFTHSTYTSSVGKFAGDREFKCVPPFYYYLSCGIPIPCYCGMKDATSILLCAGMPALLAAKHIYWHNASSQTVGDYQGPSGDALLERDKWYISWNLYHKGFPSVQIAPEKENEAMFDKARKNLKEYLLPPDLQATAYSGSNKYHRLTGRRPTFTIDSIVNQIFESNLKAGRNIRRDFEIRDYKLQRALNAKIKGFGVFANSMLAMDFQISRPSKVKAAYPYPMPLFVGWSYHSAQYYFILSALGPALTEILDLQQQLEISGLPKGVAADSLLEELFKIMKNPTQKNISIAQAQLQALGIGPDRAASIIENLRVDDHLRTKLVEIQHHIGVDGKLAYLNVADTEAYYVGFGDGEPKFQLSSSTTVRSPATIRTATRALHLMQIGINLPMGDLTVTNTADLDRYFIKRRI